MISPHGDSFAPNGGNAHERASWSFLSQDSFSKPPDTLAGNCLACVPEQAAVEKRTCPRVHRMRVLLATVLQSTKFEWATASLIVLNTVLIGVEQSYRLNGREIWAINVCENWFLAFFSMEILGRVLAFGLGCFRSRWVVFDSVLISVSVLATWIFPFFTDGLSESLGIFMVMRTVRLLRLGRTLRLLIRFKELWMLVRGLLGSAYTILYTLVLLSVIIYMFASLGIEIITNNPNADPVAGDPEFVRVVEENFASLSGTMLTLIQFATLDSVASIYTPLIRAEPYLVVYFAAVIVVLGIVLMNLITAVVVNSALDQATQDKAMVALELQKKKARCIRDVSRLFQRIDTDDSGTLTREEFTSSMREEGDDKAMLLQIVSMEPEEIFDALDVSGDGEVSIEEFCEVLWTASNNKGCIEIKRTEKKLDVLRAMLEELLAGPAAWHWRRKRRRTVTGGTTPSDAVRTGGTTPSDTMRPVPLAMERRRIIPREPPPRAALNEHQEAVVHGLDPETSGETNPCSHSGEAWRVSPTALPISVRATAMTNSEPSWKGTEVALPYWATIANETLIRELQVTRQMLVQEVHHACRGVYEITAPTASGKLPVHPDMPHNDYHCDSAAPPKPVAGAPPRGPGPQAPAARQTERPGCLMEGEASKEPSAWRSCPSPDLPDATIHFDVRPGAARNSSVAGVPSRTAVAVRPP